MEFASNETRSGEASLIVPDKVVVNNSLSMAAAPSSISSILVSGLAWTLTPGLFSTPSYPNLTVACTWTGETRTAVLQGIPDVATSAQAINVTGFTPSTSSHPVSCSATLYYSTGGPATGAASTVSTAATYCVASNVTMACPGLTGLAINTTLIPSSTSWHTTSYECIPPAFETVSVSCTGPRAGSATYKQNSTAGAVASNEPSAFVGVAVPPLAGSVAYQCRSTLHYVGVRFNATAAHLVQAAMSTCAVPAAPVRFVADNALALTVTPTSTTSVATSSISWLLLPSAGAIDTPVYGNMTLTCTGNGITQVVTASPLAGVSSAAPMNVTGLPETPTSYDITCNASLPYGSGSVAAASIVVPSVAAKDVASTLAFNVSVLNATAVVTTPIVWALTDSGAADTPAYKSLTVNCESNGVMRTAVLGVRIPNAATTSESGLVITGLPDTASYHVYCTASLLYSYAGVATGSTAVIVPHKVVVNNSLSMAAAPSSISSILVSGLAWTLTPGLFSTPSFPNLTVACTWNGETRTAVLQGIPDVATSAQAINVTGFTPSTSSHPVSCSATLYYSTGGPATGAASTVSTAATYCVASNVTMACPGLTGLAINTTLIPSSTSWHTTSYECIPPAFETVSVSCTGPRAGSATYQQNSTAGAVASNEPSAFVGVAVPPLAGSVAYQCRSTLHYVGVRFNATAAHLVQAAMSTCAVPAAPVRFVADNALALTVTPTSTTSVATSSISWLLLPSAGAINTPVYGNMTLTCTGNGITQVVTASPLAGVSSAAPMNVTGLPETPTSYDITCNASLPYGSGSVAAASIVVPSVAAKDVASTLAFNVSVLNATAVVTTPIVWALTDSGAADTPAYKSLTVNCESNGVMRAAVLGVRIPNAATTSERVATGSTAVIVSDKTVLNNSLSMAAAPSSISSILVSGLAWTLTPGLFSTPSFPNLTVACTWNGETRTAVLQGIPDVATSAQAINVTGFTPSTSSHPVSCSATLYYSTGGPATGAASTVSTAATYCVASNVTMACPGLTGLAINTTLIPSSTSWHTTSYECIPPAFETVSVSCTGPRAGSATYQQNSTAGAVASNEPSAFVGVAVPPLAGSVAYQCRSTLHYVGTGYNASEVALTQSTATTCVVPPAPIRWVVDDRIAFSFVTISTTSILTSEISWLLPDNDAVVRAVDTPVYGNMTLACTGNGVTEFVTASPLAGVSSAAPMNVTGLPETPTSYDITCNASLPYGSGSVAAASVVVPSVAAKDVASTLAFNVSVLNATAVVTTPIVWALTGSGAADTPAYKSLTVNCESNGVMREAVLGVRIPNAATTSESGLVITGLPDTASYHVYCTASLLYSYAGVATGSTAVIVPHKVVVNNSLSMAAAPSSISSILVSGLAWTLTPGLFSTPTYSNITVACTVNGLTLETIVKTLGPATTRPVSDSAEISGFQPALISLPVNCTATLFYSSGGARPAVGSASAMSIAAPYCTPSHVAVACPGLTRQSIRTTSIPSSTSWRTNVQECIPPSFRTVSVSCTGPETGSATLQQNSTAGAVASNEPSAFVGVVVPPLAGSVAYQCRSTLHYVGVGHDSTVAASVVQVDPTICYVPAAPYRWVLGDLLSFSVAPASNSTVSISDITWSLRAIGAIDSPVYGNLSMACTAEGTSISQTLLVTSIAPGSSHVSAFNLTDTPDTSSFPVTCMARLPYFLENEREFEARGRASFSLPDKTVLNNSLSITAAPSSISSILVSGLAWTLTPGLFSTPSFPNLTVACTWNGETRTAVLQGIPDVATSAQAINVTGFTPSTSSHPVSCSATLYYSTGGPATGAASTVSTAATYCVASNVTMACPGLTGLAINTTLIPSSTSFHTTSYECIPPAFETVSVSCTGPSAATGSATYQQNSTAGAVASNEPSAFVGVVVPPLAGSVAYQCRSTLHYVGAEYNATKAIAAQQAPTACIVPAARARLVAEDTLTFSIIPISTTAVSTSSITWALTKQGAIDTPVYGKLEVTCAGLSSNASAAVLSIPAASASAAPVNVTGLPESWKVYRIYCTAVLAYGENRTASGIASALSLLNATLKDASNGQALPTYTATPTPSPNANASAPSTASSTIRIGNRTYEVSADGSSENEIVISMQEPVVQIPQNASDEIVTISLEGLVNARSGENEESDAGDVEVYLLSGEGALSDSEAIMLDATMQNNEVQFRVPSLSEGKRRRALAQFEAGRAYDVQIKSSTDAFPSLRIANALSWSSEGGAGSSSSSSGAVESAYATAGPGDRDWAPADADTNPFARRIKLLQNFVLRPLMISLGFGGLVAVLIVIIAGVCRVEFE
eukprot:tig00020944_g16350.t1